MHALQSGAANKAQCEQVLQFVRRSRLHHTLPIETVLVKGNRLEHARCTFRDAISFVPPLVLLVVQCCHSPQPFGMRRQRLQPVSGGMTLLHQRDGGCFICTINRHSKDSAVAPCWPFNIDWF